jgi:hypothetical protein
MMAPESVSSQVTLSIGTLQISFDIRASRFKMAVLMDNLLLHAWQRIASERFRALSMMLQFTIMTDVLVFPPQLPLALDVPFRPALEFPSISQLLLSFSRKQPIQTMKMA